jgi:N-acetyl-gamma-glutamyl-phosphate reductase
VDQERGRVIVVSAIDNLTRGASGLAVYNFNLMAGFPETLGLDLVPTAP